MVVVTNYSIFCITQKTNVNHKSSISLNYEIIDLKIELNINNEREVYKYITHGEAYYK